MTTVLLHFMPTHPLASTLECAVVGVAGAVVIPKNPLDFPFPFPFPVALPCCPLKLDILGVEIVGKGIGIGFDVRVIAEGVADPDIYDAEGCVGEGGKTNSV